MEELLKIFMKGKIKTFCSCRKLWGKKEDTKLVEMLLRIYDFIQSNPWPKQWIKEKVESFNLDNIDFNKSTWVKIIKEQISQSSKELLEVAQQALSICLEPEGPKEYIDAINDDISILEKIISLCKGDIQDLYKFIHQISFKRLRPCSKETDENLKEECKELRDMIKKEIQKKFQDEILFKSQKKWKRPT